MASLAQIEILGVAHYRVEFADVVRATLARLRPAAIAVELPSTLAEPVQRAVRRLPQLSVVLYQTKGGQAVYLPIEPTDPIVEAIRSGDEQRIPVAFVDLDVDAYPAYRDALPDPYAITRVGYAAYAAAFRAAARPRGALDRQRERFMAARCARLAEEHGGPVLLVCGLAHANGVADALAAGNTAQPLSRARRQGVSLFHLDPECLPEVLGELPFVEAVYELRRSGAPAVAKQDDAEPLAPGRRVGAFRVIEGRPSDEREELVRAVRRAALRAGAEPFAGPLDRLRVQAALFDEADTRNHALTGEHSKPWQRRAFARFARRLALAGGQLVPDLFDLIVAARGCVDENFAYETWRLGAAYPAQKVPAELPVARISGEDLLLGTKRVRLRPRTPHRGRRAGPFPLRRRRVEQRPGEFLEGFRGEGICSYPPEDLVIESFGQRLKRRGKALLVEERARSEPLRASLADGVDVRETIRHWHLEGEIFVRELGRTPGEVGSVVVIFDEDADDARYPFRLTWLGEHAQESDMAFYATDPRAAVVGPGICRAEHGGFLLSLPPQRMLDVWSDPRYDVAETKQERLILAALDYSVEPVVVVVAPRAPSRRVRSWAARLGRRLVYLPLGQLSPATLRRLRVLHVLDGHARRETARDYIW